MNVLLNLVSNVLIELLMVTDTMLSSIIKMQKLISKEDDYAQNK
jgi:hypothetical protein